jgi:LPXTG-site transpeptidase (sortase) family protein
MSQKETISYLLIRTLGNFLVLLSLYGVIATFAPIISSELSYHIMQKRGVVIKVSKDKESSKSISKTPVVKTVSFMDILAGSKEQIMTPIDPLFSILIPKIGANVKVIPNVDPENPKEYLTSLQQGVAHAKGSVFPGHPGITYLFAHSANNWWEISHYNAVFYPINNLTTGDEIDIFFEKRRYVYHVTQKIISSPQDVTFLTSQHTGAQQLVLQTCWPPGTAFKRLYVVAKK